MKHPFSVDFRKPCFHTGQTEILNIGGVSIGAANASGIRYADASLVIDLAGVASCERTSPAFSLLEPTKNSELERFVACRQVQYNVLSIAWLDGDIPPPRLRLPSEWRELFHAIKQERRVVVCCYGGHGRTGTALAAMLLVARQAKSAEEAIAMVRERHCEHAIESQAQVDYLGHLAKLV